jgi:endonuclease YncB( thermonuclease family)
MLPRECQACVCVGVHGIDRITLAAVNENAEQSSATFDITLAGVDLPNNSGGVDSSGQQSHPFTSTTHPFYVMARDWLRRQILGRVMTLVSISQRVGFLYAASSLANDPDPTSDDLMINAQLVKLGLVLARSSAVVHSNPQSAAEKRRLWLKSLEDTAREKGVGLHGVGRMAEVVREIKPFPSSQHPYHTLLVHHVQSADYVKASVEAVNSPFLLTCVLSRSQQEIQVRICGVLPPKNENYFMRARDLLMRVILHREIVLAMHGFDDTTQTFWARIVSAHGDAVCDMLERGLVQLDPRASALPTSYIDRLTTAEIKARQARLGVWSSAPAMVVPHPMICEITGIVHAVVDECTFQIRVTASPTEDGPMLKAESYLVRLQHLCAPGSSCSRSHKNMESSSSKVIEAGTVVTYPPRSFYGREILRRMLIGDIVTVMGSVRHAPTTAASVGGSAPQHVILASAVTRLRESNMDVTRTLLSHYPCWYALSFSTTSSFPLVSGSHDLVPPPLLTDALSCAIGKDDDDNDDHVVLCATGGDRLPPLPTNPSELPPVNVLYVATNAQLQCLLKGRSLPLSTPLPCIVEDIQCSVVQGGTKITLSILVYLTTIGVAVPIILEGIRLPLIIVADDEAPPANIHLAKKALADHCGHMRAFLERSLLHRDGTVTLLRSICTHFQSTSQAHQPAYHSGPASHCSPRNQTPVRRVIICGLRRTHNLFRS